MRRADSLLKPFIKDLGIEDGIKLSEIRRHWNTLFHEPLSCHMAPSLLTRGELLLTVDSPVWLQELNFCRADVLKKLVPYGVAAIRFRLGRISTKTNLEGSRQKSKMRRLTDTEKAFIREAVAGIRDEGVKETVEMTMQRAIVSGKTKIREP